MCEKAANTSEAAIQSEINGVFILTRDKQQEMKTLVFKTGAMRALGSDGQFIGDGHKNFENGHER